MDNQPLVSVVVVSYNSATTVIETLESIKNQTYKNIELILSDDCSKDDTVIVAKDWFGSNSTVFRNTILLTAEKNQGVCRNFNNAISKASGSWIKIIAADDILLPNCIEDFVDYITKTPDAEFVCSYQRVYNNIIDDKNIVKQSLKRNKFFDLNTQDQLKSVAYEVCFNAPTMFFEKKLFDDIGGFDERYSYEDHPFYVKITEKNKHIFFLEKETVGYRVHQSTYNSNEHLFNYKFSRESKRFRKECCYKYYSWRQKIAWEAYYSMLSFLNLMGLNKKNKVTSNLFRLSYSLILRIGR